LIASASFVCEVPARCQGNSVSSQEVAMNSALFSSSFWLGRHARDEALGDQVQAQQRVGVALQRRVHGGREQRPQRRVQIAGLQDVEHVELAHRHRVAPAGAVVGRPAEPVRAQALQQLGEVADRARRDPRAGAVGA
jgi:hypothetical protein